MRDGQVQHSRGHGSDSRPITHSAYPILAVLLNKPLETAGSLVMLLATMAIFINALFFQSSFHPAPFFKDAVVSVLERRPVGDVASAVHPGGAAGQGQSARSVEVSPSGFDQARSRFLRSLQTELASRGYYDGQADGVAGPKTEAAIRAFQAKAGLNVDGAPSEELLARVQAARSGADPIVAILATNATAPDKKILFAEKALTALGYGPLRVDGLKDSRTREAIERFERDHSLPVTGEISDRLRRELTIVSGLSLE